MNQRFAMAFGEKSVESTSGLWEMRMRNYLRQYDALEKELMRALPGNPVNASDQALGGCPSPADLRRFEAGKYGHHQEERDAIMAHLAGCDRCLAEVVQSKRRRVRMRRAGLVLAFAAAVLIVVSISLQRPAAISNGLATIDLRLSSPARGLEQVEDQGAIKICRNVSHLQLIMLPGSEGSYEFQLLGDKQTGLVSHGAGEATVENDKVILNLDTRVAPRLTPGKYKLALRRNSSDWEYYRLVVE
jgi:hypothetical protein